MFRGNCGHLKQTIAGVGELVEEEVPVVPRYDEMRPIVARKLRESSANHKLSLSMRTQIKCLSLKG